MSMRIDEDEYEDFDEEEDDDEDGRMRGLR